MEETVDFTKLGMKVKVNENETDETDDDDDEDEEDDDEDLTKEVKIRYLEDIDPNDDDDPGYKVSPKLIKPIIKIGDGTILDNPPPVRKKSKNTSYNLTTEEREDMTRRIYKEDREKKNG